MRSIRFRFSMVLFFGLAACNNPYALGVAKINEHGKDLPAAIQLSTPQVFARETLINDRRAEGAYLEKLLNDSTDLQKVQFESQLRRELLNITSLGAGLTATFDPAAGAAFGRSEALADITNEVELTRQRLELAKLRQEIENLSPDVASLAANPGNAQGTPGPEESPGAGAADAGGSGSSPESQDPSVMADAALRRT